MTKTKNGVYYSIKVSGGTVKKWKSQEKEGAEGARVVKIKIKPLEDRLQIHLEARA